MLLTIQRLWQHSQGAIYGLFAFVFLGSLLLQWLELGPVVQYSRLAIQQGEWWTLISGHYIHLNWSHYWMNMAGLLLGAVFFGRYYSPKTWAALMLFCSLLIGLALYGLNPELQYYVGLSGVLHGLLVAGAIEEYRHYPKSALVLWALLIAKLVWEQLAGALPGSSSMAGGHVVVDAHLYGAIAGLIFALGHQLIHIHDRHQDRQYDQ